MWYFQIKQRSLETSHLQTLQKQAATTEIEQFGEPYENWCLFAVGKDSYQAFVDYLDREGIIYELKPERPTRSELLAGMK